MRIVGVVAACFLLGACIAETVVRRPPRRGPVAEVGYVDLGGGEVRYSLEGWSAAVSSRRRTAQRLMRSNCGDLTPRIVDEYPHEDADATYEEEDVSASFAEGADHYHVERFMHLIYECRPKGEPAPAVSTGAAHAPIQIVPPTAAPQK